MKKQDIENYTNLVIRIGAGILAAKFLVIPFWRSTTRELQKNEIEKISKKYTYNLVGKSGYKYQVNLDTMADIIFDAFHGSRFYEDEQRAIDQLNLIPKNLVLILAQRYMEKFGKSLKGDFVKYLSTSEYNQIANKFSGM